jgi:hypothetical protein
MPQGQGYLILDGQTQQPIGQIPPGTPLPPDAIQAAQQGVILIADPSTGQPINPQELAGQGGPPGGMPQDLAGQSAMLQQGQQQGTVRPMPPGGGPGGPPGMGPAGAGAPDGMSRQALEQSLLPGANSVQAGGMYPAPPNAQQMMPPGQPPGGPMPPQGPMPPGQPPMPPR